MLGRQFVEYGLFVDAKILRTACHSPSLLSLASGLYVSAQNCAGLSWASDPL